MLSFDCDYVAEAHPKVLQKLTETNIVDQRDGDGFAIF